jgi:hypothetical protein
MRLSFRVISPFVPLVEAVFLVLAFLDFPSWEVISGRSLKYLAGFGGSLRGKCCATLKRKWLNPLKVKTADYGSDL